MIKQILTPKVSIGFESSKLFSMRHNGWPYAKAGVSRKTFKKRGKILLWKI